MKAQAAGDASGQSSDVVLDLVAARCNASAVLCKLDPLYCGKGVQKIKLPSNPNFHEKILVQIGVYNRRTTTGVTVVTNFVFDPEDDNALFKCTLATSPLLKDTLKTSTTDAWLPSWYEVAESVCCRTEYEADASRARPRGGGEELPVYRSLGAGGGAAEDEVPAPRSESMAVCEEPAAGVAEVPVIEELGATDDGVPTFEGLLAMLGIKTGLIGFLVNPNISHVASLATIDVLKTTLESLKAIKVKNAAAPFSVINTIEKTVGPSVESFAVRIHEAAAVLSGLNMRYNTAKETDFNIFSEPLPLRDVDVAIARVEYLLLGATVLHAHLLALYKKPLWRAVIDVHPVVEHSRAPPLHRHAAQHLVALRARAPLGRHPLGRPERGRARRSRAAERRAGRLWRAQVRNLRIQPRGVRGHRAAPQPRKDDARIRPQRERGLGGPQRAPQPL